MAHAPSAMAAATRIPASVDFLELLVAAMMHHVWTIAMTSRRGQDYARRPALNRVRVIHIWEISP